MTDHNLLFTLNVIRSVILIAAIVGAVSYQHINRRLVILVAIVLLALNLCGLAIATFLVNHAH